MSNDHVNTLFQGILNGMKTSGHISPTPSKEEKKKEIKDKIMALNGEHNMYVTGLQAAIKRDFNFENVVAMILDYCKTNPVDMDHCLGKELITLIKAY